MVVEVPLRGHHLAGDESLPDDLVEPELIWRESAPDARRARELWIGRADGLVRFLGGLVGGREEVGLLGQILVAECPG
jgi:hypothetical protein